MTRDLGRVGGSQAGRHAGRWTGRLVACLWVACLWVACLWLAAATPAAAVQPTPDPTSYADCMRIYSHWANAASYCRQRFPLSTSPTRTAPIVRATPSVGGLSSRPPIAVVTPPATATPPASTTPTPTTPPSTANPAPSAGRTPSAEPPARPPVDITPTVNRFIERWANRPRTPKPPPGTPADPLAVIPEIQAACAPYAGVPERWRRCTADAWRTAGLRGQPPLVLQNPPVVAPPPPVQPPPVQPPPTQSDPRIEPPPPPAPDPVEPAPAVEPDAPPVAVVEPEVPVTRPPPAVVTPQPPPERPSIPIWLWLAALVADPGLVVLTPDGPPRAGMAVSLRCMLAPDADGVRLDYPRLETAP